VVWVTFSFANFNDLLKTCRHLRIDLKGEEEKKWKEKQTDKKRKYPERYFVGERVKEESFKATN
jgi:hypothetical protein